MRAITVSVDYADIFALTILHNVHHFDEYWIVTSLDDVDTHNLYHRAKEAGKPVYLVKTDRFYERGATFAKWAGLELGLEIMERRGFIAVLDADVLWPTVLPFSWHPTPGNLYTPLRRMFPDLRLPVPPESEWQKWPLHPQQVEWAGYSQIFHADDPALGKPPWYDVSWKHAGGADSFFQRKWHPNKKARPPFEVLHLGSSGANWCGRVAPYLDGSVDSEAGNRTRQLQGFLAQRCVNRATGDPYRHERLGS